MMDQPQRITAGAKRRSDFTDTQREVAHRVSFPQHQQTSESSQASSSRTSSLDDCTSNASNHRSRFGSRPHSTPDALTHPEDSTQTSPASFILPSLSPTNAIGYKLPPISLSSPRPAPLGNLAYEQGNSDFIIQNLQRENARLMSETSSSRTQVMDLDEQVRASRLEIAKLVKDRQRLKAKIDVLEAEVDELQNNMEVSQQHTAAKDAQYSQIVDLSTKLQGQGAADAQHRKAQQEQWIRDKQNMERVIKTLEAEIHNLRTSIHASTARHVDGSGPLPTPSRMTDHARLGAGEDGLEHANTNTVDALLDIRKQHAHLMECIEKLGSIGKNMQTRFSSMDAVFNPPHAPND